MKDSSDKRTWRLGFGGRGTHPRRGMVLIVVTVVILLVSLAAYGFLTLMETENKAALARGGQLQAQSVAASGREYLAHILGLPRSERPAGADRDDMADLFGGVLVDGAPDGVERDARQGRFSVIAPNQSEMASRKWRFGYENESAKINLAFLLDLERDELGAAREALMNLPNMDESTADAIMDWVDADDARRAQGADPSYYRRRDTPRRPRNAVPPTLEELLLVKGVTRTNLFGVDMNADFQIDASEEKFAKQDTAFAADDAAPWCRYLTVHSGERDEAYDGSSRIKLNQTDVAALHGELSAAFNPTWANFIVAYRQYGPHSDSGGGDVGGSGGGSGSQQSSMSSGRAGRPPSAGGRGGSRRSRGRRPGSGSGTGSGSGSSSGSNGAGAESESQVVRDASELSVDLSRPAEHKIDSPLELIDARVAIPRDQQNGDDESEVEVYESPFRSDPGQMEQHLPRFMDGVTVGNGSPIYGRINVNLAPPEVLAALPEVDPALADRIVSARGMASADDPKYRHAVWLLLEGIVDRGTMIQLEKYVTTGGSVGRAQIIGYYDRASPIMRFETVVDGTEQPARQVYYKGLQRLGRGIAEDVMKIASGP